MKTHRCSRCKKVKPVNQFYERTGRPGRYSAYCKPCFKIRHDEYYAKRKDYYRDKRRRNIKKLKEEIDKLKDVPCSDCKKRYPSFVMEFDHRDPTTKVGEVAKLRGWGFKTKALEEVKKCDVVCSNCHRIRTHGGRSQTG